MATGVIGRVTGLTQRTAGEWDGRADRTPELQGKHPAPTKRGSGKDPRRTLNPNTNQVACTLTIAIDEDENVGVQQSEVISVSVNPGATGASYAGATATGGTCPGTSNVTVAGPTQINVDPQAPSNINNCTIIVEEVLNATSAGEVCQTLDSLINAPPHTVCAQIGAPPTSKEQCENGGWETYGFFKNRGDCVSFVATGGENEPGKNIPRHP